MVTARFLKRRNQYRAECTGHATGDPVVCAGVSAAMSVLSAVARESVEGDGKYIAVLGQDTGSETVFHAVRHTVERIAHTYPELVEVESIF